MYILNLESCKSGVVSSTVEICTSSFDILDIRVTQSSITFKNDFKISQSSVEFETQGRHSIYGGGGGVARRSESRTPKYLSNIPKVQSESSKTEFGTNFYFH